MTAPDDPLHRFHPATRDWFVSRFSAPTAVQRLAWPRIAAGEHLLATAPTGSGKTLAAFLWAIDRLLSGAWPREGVAVLYVSPLRALGTDIRRNLTGPLIEIGAAFEASGTRPPEIRASVRSGDTPTDERARMARRPPEILITTPESLNILLTSRGGRSMLGRVRCLVLDEVHAVIATKRGAHLATAVERLAALAGEFQRIALSATLDPPERGAAWVGGFRIENGHPVPRPVAIVRDATPKAYDLTVEFPGLPERDDGASTPVDRGWFPMAAAIRRPLERNRSTLVFADSRRTVERLTRLVNDAAGGEEAYAHHGSLSRELRAVVESRLKRGELRGVIATSSLELGIDVGTVDEVLLVGAPPTVAAAAQRIGRAGHGVGEISRGRFLARTPRELLQAAVTARAVLDGAIEPQPPLAAPLDVLAQVLVSMVAAGPADLDTMFDLVRSSAPYRDLPRALFDRVLDMTAGRYASSRIPELRPLLSVDRVDRTARARPGAARRVYLSGGTIPDRGYFHLRVDGGGALLGELDEEFVWERRIGDTFALGTQHWRIHRMTHNDVFVTPAGSSAAIAPFWRAEERHRGFEISARVGEFLERIEGRLDDPALVGELARTHRLSDEAGPALVAFLRAARAALGGVLPHRHRVVVERATGRGSARPALILHTFWGGRVNRPFAAALEAAWEERHGTTLDTAHDDDSIAIDAPTPPDPSELLAAVAPDRLERLVASRFEASGSFGALFREAAAIALLLPREGFRRRTPLWLSRQRAKDLLDATGRWGDFPVRLEAWRACLADRFDLGNLVALLEEIRSGVIEVREVDTTAPSPLAAGVIWKRTNTLMYEDDAPERTLDAGPRLDLVREAVHAAHLRPRLGRETTDVFARKLRRVWPGYAPRDPAELLDHAVERGILDAAGWEELLAAAERDAGTPRADLLRPLEAKIVAIRPRGAEGPILVGAVESMGGILGALGLPADPELLLRPEADAPASPAAREAFRKLAPPADRDDEPGDPTAELAATWLRFSGPVPLRNALAPLGLDAEAERQAIEALVDARRVVVDHLTDGATQLEICDAANLESLLRLARAASRPSFEPRPLRRLPGFLADWQGVGSGDSGTEAVRRALEALFGWAAPVDAWETEILPARVAGYRPDWLDTLFAESSLRWAGRGERRVAFFLEEESGLFAEPAAPANEADGADSWFPSGLGRYAFEDLVASSGRTTAEVSRLLWEGVWRGRISDLGFASLRRAVASGFEPESIAPAAGGRSRRLRFSRWRGSRPFGGAWRRLAPAATPGDALDREETDLDRARVLLDRYGIVFRELVERESAPLGWGRLARSFRRMELSGEVAAGQFFTGIPGVQFATREALDRLAAPADPDRTCWMQASDPASVCGLGLAGLDDHPRRLPSTHLAYRGGALAAISERGGRRLTILREPGAPGLADDLAFLRDRLGRSVDPPRSIAIDTINDAPAATSPYRPTLGALGELRGDGASLRLTRRY